MEQDSGRYPQTSLLQDILSLLSKIFLLLIMFVLLFTFLFGIFSERGLAMKPAVQDGDIVIFYRLAKHYIANDVVILEHEGQRQVRRVVAVAGDTVDITEDGLFINGGGITDQTGQRISIYEEGITFPVTIPEGHVFVLGDNRKDAVDSRLYGTIAINDLLGKVTTIIRQRNI